MKRKHISEDLSKSEGAYQGSGFERGFIWKMTISSSAAYLWAAVPQVYIDPELEVPVVALETGKDKDSILWLNELA